MELANRLPCRLSPHRLVRLCAVWLLSALVAPLALAAPDVSDPPGRVGRLSELIGQVWLYAPDTGEWVAATRNRPLTTGERLSTDPGARAEVRIGSTTLRLDSGSELEVLRLDDETLSLQLHHGSLAARLRNRDAVAEFDLKTGEGQFRPQRTGRYRFDRIDEASHLTVYNGQALYEGPRSALTVYSGQRAEFWIDSANAAQYSITEPEQDAFSAWNGERDRRDERSVSSRYVSPEMTGVEDLDRHGRWEQSDEYGALWFPRRVAPGWAPYSTGYWAWVSPWGWTWVDDAPWGFAPFHYGRWVWYRDAWCWSPGSYVRRPVYAPALVAWVGGPNLSVSVTIGGGGRPGPAVGWFPLAPREVYVPSYRVSPRYVRNINVTHVTNITHIDNIVNRPDHSAGQRDFRNRKFPHAVTVVPTDVMTGRQPVAPAAAQWRNNGTARAIVGEAARAPALTAAPVQAPVAPSRRLDPRAAAEAQAGGNGPVAPQRRWSRPIQRGAAEAGNDSAAAATATGPRMAPVNPTRPQVGTESARDQAAQPPARWPVPPRQAPQAPTMQANPAAPPSPTAEPRLRGRPGQGQEARPEVRAPAAPQGQATPRAQPGERPTPERRHHGRPPEASAERPADRPAPPARAEGRPQEERGDRRSGTRDRKEQL